MVALAGGQAVLLVFEDAHWCDPTSLKVLEAVIDRIPSGGGIGGDHLPARVRAALGRTGQRYTGKP